MKMKKAVFFVFGWLYLLTFKALFNIFGNIYWLIIIPFKYSKEYRRERKQEYKKIKMMEKTEYLKYLRMNGKFRYDGILQCSGVLSKWPTWTALPYITVMRGLEGNCQDFALLNKTVLGKGAKIKIYVPLSIKKLSGFIHYVVEYKLDDENYSEHAQDSIIVSNIYTWVLTIDQFKVLEDWNNNCKSFWLR